MSLHDFVSLGFSKQQVLSIPPGFSLHPTLRIFVPEEWSTAAQVENLKGQPLQLDVSRGDTNLSLLQRGWTRKCGGRQTLDLWNEQDAYIECTGPADGYHDLYFVGNPRPDTTQMLLIYHLELFLRSINEEDSWLCGFNSRNQEARFDDRYQTPPTLNGCVSGDDRNVYSYLHFAPRELSVSHGWNTEPQSLVGSYVFMNDRVVFLRVPAGACFRIFKIYGLEK